MAQTALFIYFSLSQISIAGGHIFATAPLSYILFDENTEQLGQKESVFCSNVGYCNFLQG